MYGWVIRSKMAVKGVVLKKMALEEDKFERSANNFRKWLCPEENFGSFYGFQENFAVWDVWVLKFLRRSWYTAAYHVPPGCDVR